MTWHPRLDLVSRRCPAPWCASYFSSSSYRFLSVVLELGDILARVAFLPNESYAGRADNILHRVIMPTSSTYSPGFLRPGAFLVGTPTFKVRSSCSPDDGCRTTSL